MFGEGGDDVLIGNNGADTLDGGCGYDVLSGGHGDDVLTDVDDHGNNLLFGGFGNDTLTAGANDDFLAGGRGDDIINAGGGANVLAFRREDGSDTIISSDGASNTLSLGGGISYDDLALRRSGNDLILETGKNDQITFKDWYAGAEYRTFVDLQMIEDASNDYNAASGDKLRNNSVVQFDFKKLVDQFDAARNSTPTLSRWTAMNGLLDAYLTGSDFAAIGGDIAYQYGAQGGLGDVGLNSAQEAFRQSGFGSQPQAIHRDGSGVQKEYRIGQ